MHEYRNINCFVLVASKKQPATAENSVLEGDPAAIASVTDGELAAITSVTAQVAIEPPDGEQEAIFSVTNFGSWCDVSS